MCKTKINGFKCMRCGYNWVPRGELRPKVCPKCMSPYWDRKKIRTGGKKNGE